MANQQLIDYIKQQIQQGTDKEQIKQVLISNGWKEEDIEAGFEATMSKDDDASVQLEQPPKLLRVMRTITVVLTILGGIPLVFLGVAALIMGDVVLGRLWSSIIGAGVIIIGISGFIFAYGLAKFKKWALIWMVVSIILIYIFNAISVYLTSRSLFISVLTPLLVNFFPILATVYFWKLRKWFT